MLVHRTWERGNKRYGTWKRWQGLFLFGLIPLYVKLIGYSDGYSTMIVD